MKQKRQNLSRSKKTAKMIKLLQNQQLWRVKSTEFEIKPGSKIPQRVDLPKLARAKGFCAIFIELQPLKPGIGENGAKCRK